MTNKWTVILEADPENPGELMMPFPPELLAQMGWDYGDVLEWEEADHGSFTLTKKESDV
jgi:hypothetical protein